MPSFNPITFRFQECDYSLQLSPECDEKISHNISQLFQRSKGELWRLDQQGKLQKIQGVREKFKYFWEKKKERAKVKQAIDTALENLDEILKSQNENLQAASVQYLFDKHARFGIGRLSQALYTQKILKCDNLLSLYLIPPQTMRLKLGNQVFIDLTHKKIADQKFSSPIIDLTLNNSISSHNLKMLMKRKRGMIFQVNEEGKLEKMRKRVHWGRKSETAKKVEGAVSQVLDDLQAFFSQNEATQAHQFAVRQIFHQSGPLCRMSRTIFYREKIKEGSELERLLAPNFGEKRDRLKKALDAIGDAKSENEKKIAKHEVEQAFMDLTCAEFDFTHSLGMDLEKVKDGGTGGARYAFDRYGTRILVIKAGDEGQNGMHNPNFFHKIKRLFFMPKACLEGNSEPLSEVDSWLWDRHFDVWSVPPTEVRYVLSKSFKGKSYKQCSVQMYVSNCEGTLGEYIQVSEKIQWMPRTFLRWYCGSKKNRGIFSHFGHRREKQTKLLERIPQLALERVAIHNFGTEDTDGHYGNMLVRIKDLNQELTPFCKVFAGDKSETKELVQHLFRNNSGLLKGSQDLLDQLLHSETIEISREDQTKEKKQIFLVKHDGGSSNPQDHPLPVDYLTLRYKHLFEVMPHFEQPFAEITRQHFLGKDGVFLGFLLEKAYLSIRNIMTQPIFEEFCKTEGAKQNLKEWIFETDTEKRIGLQRTLVDQLFYVTLLKREPREIISSPKQEKKYKFYFNYHLKRIHNNLKTRVESFLLLDHFLKNKMEMRKLLRIKNSYEFKKELSKNKISFASVMEAWKNKPILVAGMQNPGILLSHMNAGEISMKPGEILATLGV